MIDFVAVHVGTAVENSLNRYLALQNRNQKFIEDFPDEFFVEFIKRLAERNYVHKDWMQGKITKIWSAKEDGRGRTSFEVKKGDNVLIFDFMPFDLKIRCNDKQQEEAYENNYLQIAQLWMRYVANNLRGERQDEYKNIVDDLIIIASGLYERYIREYEEILKYNRRQKAFLEGSMFNAKKTSNKSRFPKTKPDAGVTEE